MSKVNVPPALQEALKGFPFPLTFNTLDHQFPDSDGVVINDPQVLQLIKDKRALYSELSRLGVGPNYQPIEVLLNESGISMNEFNEMFPTGAMMVDPSGVTQIASISDLISKFDALSSHKEDGVLAAASKNGGRVTLMPSLEKDPFSKALTSFKSTKKPELPPVVGGVLQNTVEGRLSARAEYDARRVAKMLGLDYATITLQYTDGKCEVVDITVELMELFSDYAMEMLRYAGAIPQIV